METLGSNNQSNLWFQTHWGKLQFAKHYGGESYYKVMKNRLPWL